MLGAGRRRRAWSVLAVSYLALLLISHAVEPPYERQPSAEQQLTVIERVDGDELGERSVRLAWRRWVPTAPPAKAPSIPVVLLHGSPGSHDDFERLAPRLLRRGRVLLAPDLPGFGASSRRVPDYSIGAHARYVARWLDALGVERAHLLGFSMGGGVALELYRLAPERVASLVMLSSIGVQELELLGDGALNRVLHGLQLAAIWVANETVPHCGLLTHFALDVPYARNFYDSDQQALRALIGTVEPPVLVVHGRRDFLVPPEAAIEHHRLLPQSDLVMLDAGHFFVFTGEPDVSGELDAFWTRVERGRATTRSTAEPARVAAAAAPFDRRSAPAWTGPALLVVGALLALATLVSEDLTTIGAGLLVADGRLPFLAATAACFLGIFAGDLALFGAGRLLGRKALRAAPLRYWLDGEAVARGSAWFERRGPAVVLLSRFTPGTRLGTYFAAGLLRTSFWRFAAYMAVAVGVWTPLLVVFARAMGETAFERLGALRANLLLLLLVPLAILLVLRRVVIPLFSWRGRRELVGRWRRWTRWEFWPPWLFYPPIVLYALWLGVRHRGLTVFTAANPAFPGGGFVGESKAQILSLLAAGDRPACARSVGGDEASEHVAPAGSVVADGAPNARITVPLWRRIAAGPLAERVDAVRAFQDEAGVPFPIVLKPDVGQRGQGVETARDAADVASYLTRHPEACIAQRYVAGVEVGVFYWRAPDEDRGHVFSVTEKRPPLVVGDGRSTVEELVLADHRAVALARVYRRELGRRADRVPAAGETVKLVDVGTHARGSIFLDGGAHLTPDLEEAIDAVSRAIPGFHFGRYDLRAPSLGDVEEGRDLAVLELNGVTAESTDIYDPANSVLVAWRKLARQWRLAFEIGAANRKCGVEPTPAVELARLVWRHRRQLPW